MKIAIVAPCPVPYVVGGAEKLWWGLAAHFNEETGHQAEIIKLPSPEHDLPSLIRSYEAFSSLDLRGFDAVISGKYPAWMVEHPHHVCYMLHRLRGLYDSYPGQPELPDDLAAHPGVAALRWFMRRYPGSRTALPEFFGRWNELTAGAQPPGMLDFPGPLARELVHWLDAIALAPQAISRYAAISATVATRPGYFPQGIEVAVAHPPPHRPQAPGSRADHFFTASRLDGPKRVDLLIEAMRQVRTDLPLIIAGTGPEEARLRKMGAGDPRIRFVGFQSDSEVSELYRNALAVPFVPYQEDYGLIAVEAMQCAKPVITTRDSGGPCELVEDEMSGLVCDDSAKSLSLAMQRLADDRELAQAMGKRALERASRITWPAVAEALFPARWASPRTRLARTRKLIAVSTFPIHPPRHGGQSRSFHLYRALMPEFETVIVSVCPASDSPFSGEIAPGVREVRIPMSREHERRDRLVQEEFDTPVTDVMMPQLHILTPTLREAIEREAVGACAVVTSHPYLYPAVKDLGLPIWYEAQDFELHLKTALFEDKPRGQELIAAVRAVDEACTGAAKLIMCVSSDDADAFVKEFDAPREKLVVVPNGTDAHRIAFSSADDRDAVKRKLGLEGSHLAFFMGSGHWPNIEAVKRIFEYAAEMPDVAFVVVGSVGYAFDLRMKPANILVMGEVDEVTRNLCLQVCDVALNPMEEGSGTNLKMLDYFSAGLPVITTPRGMRGLPVLDEVHCMIREIEAFPAAIEHLLGEGVADAARRAVSARELVEQRFDWDIIVGRIKPRLVELADGPAEEPSRELAAGRGIGELHMDAGND